MPSKTAMLAQVSLIASGDSYWLDHSRRLQGSGSSRTDCRDQFKLKRASSNTRGLLQLVLEPHIVKKDAAYNSWKSLAREKTDDGVENPHSSVSKTYANKIAADDAKALPVGSILVREDYGDKGKRKSISVMYRVKDYDKVHGNWYWLKYQETGSIVRGEGNKAIAGKVTSCIECHTKANGKDFTFSNDTLDSSNESEGRKANLATPEEGCSEGVTDVRNVFAKFLARGRKILCGVWRCCWRSCRCSVLLAFLFFTLGAVLALDAIGFSRSESATAIFRIKSWDRTASSVCRCGVAGVDYASWKASADDVQEVGRIP